MSDTPNLDYLREHINSMKQLLDDAHPGLFTWCEAYLIEAKALLEFFSDDSESEESKL